MLSSNQGEPLIVIASNRGPFSFRKNEDDSFTPERGVGGLVTALGALAERHEVLWVAAAMSKDDRRWAKAQHSRPQEVEGISLRLIRPNKDQYDQYYNQIANPLLWFIQHQLWDVPRKPVIDASTWKAWADGYIPINKLFADRIADSLPDDERPVIVLVQDYHLYMVPAYLRELLGQRAQIQPFVHIPWPGPDAWRILPREMRNTLLESMLEADRIGFQTQKDAFNFVQTCRFYLPEAHSHGSRESLEYKGRTVRAVAYPISVDVEKIKSLEEDDQTQLWRSQLNTMIGGHELILRVDRIEPSKNILRGLDAFRALLVRYPEHRGRVSMLALLVPSRMEVSEYSDYLREIMAMAGLINADYSDSLWEPVRIIVGDNYHRAIAAMQFYDVLLVNPLTDGMNLVAKEGPLVNQKDGVLVLSEFAGAFYELGDQCLTVSPFDIYGTAEAMHTALTMAPQERRNRANALRAIVEKADVKEWFYAQVEDAMRSDKSQVNKASTSDTPWARKSAASTTASGDSRDTTPTDQDEH